MLAKRLRREALSLPLYERVALIDELLSSIDQPDPAIDALWLEEGRRRFAAYQIGEMEAIDAEHRRCRTRRFSCDLIYRQEEETILIVAVYHLHQRPGDGKEETETDRSYRS